jgi:Domain of unknown function (DUF4349)
VIGNAEPALVSVRPSGMKAPMNLHVVIRGGAGHRRPRPAGWAAAGLLAVLAVLAVLAAGCSAGGGSVSSTAGGAGAPAQARAGAAGAGTNGAGSAQAAKAAALPAPDAHAIVYTASLTVRAADISRAAARAGSIATAAGGYISSESTRLDRAHPARSTVSLQLKIPVAAYRATLGALSTRLGTRMTVSQRAQDVTETVADVTSRVTSAQAAITQLRALLARAGSVGDLLTVQNQIDQEESDLESLQSRERALGHETRYATITLMLVSKPGAAAPRHRKAAGGFLGGLEAGWHGLRALVSLLLTGVGAALPFAGLAALAGYAAYRSRRRLRRRRASPPAAGPSTAG